MGLPLAAALTAVVIASLALAGPADMRGVLGLGVVGLFALLIVGRFFGQVSTLNAALLFFAPLLGWLPELPFVRRPGSSSSSPFVRGAGAGRPGRRASYPACPMNGSAVMPVCSAMTSPIWPDLQQRDHRPVNASSFRYPRRAFATPDRQRLAAEIVTIQTLELALRIDEPVRLDAHVVVSRSDDLALCGLDSGVERGRPPLLRLVQVMKRGGESLSSFEHDLPRVVGGIVVNNDHFPRTRTPKLAQ